MQLQLISFQTAHIAHDLATVLTGGVETGNGAAAGAQNLHTGVDYQAAHGGGETGLLLDDVVGAVANWHGEIGLGSAEVLVHTGGNEAVVPLHGGLQRIGIDAGCGGCLFQSLTVGEDGGGGAVGFQILLNVAFGDTGFAELGLPDFEGFAVQQQEEFAAGLLELGFQNGAVAGLFVDHAVAFLIYQNGAHGPACNVARNGGLGKAGVHLNAVGVALAVLHVGGLGTNGLGHLDALTGGGGGTVVQGGLHFVRQHVLVVAVAAGGQDHIGCGDGVVGIAVGGYGLDADDGAVVIGDQGLHLGA